MKLIAGLGNPGPRYADSRHNIGFIVVDALARRHKISEWRFDRDFQGQIAEWPDRGERVYLLKPLTYMNLSGVSVQAVLRFYKMTPSDLLVVFDDLDLPVGRMRIRPNGSSGGQKGMESVIQHVSTSEFARLRVGIGKVHRTNTVGHVLGEFAPDEKPEVEMMIQQAADACECWIREGTTTAMNRFNRREKE
ncbi:MAG: aminoacyl-tRNA hydrolase [Phycisphaerales bacterium]|nr:aminoacyl-tRNA hydrolase [Phycisphaerales bacterium]